MKCQILFYAENKKKYLQCCLLKFLPSMQRFKYIGDELLQGTSFISIFHC